MSNTINIYEPVTMLGAVKQMVPARTFLLDTFFGKAETQLTEKVLIDVKKGKRKMSPFVAPRVGGVTITREGFSTNSIATPRIAPQRKLTVDDISQRTVGEGIISDRTPEDRAMELLADDLIELKDMNKRRKEWMAREILTTGKCAIKGKVENSDVDIEQEIDFGFTQITDLSGADLWSASTGTPIDDLREKRLAIIKAAGKTPNVVIMASDAAAAFMANPQVVALTDKQKIKTVDITPSVVDENITFIGKIMELGLEVYSYDEWFLDDAGVEQPMLPSGTVILGRKGDLGRVIYGAITQMEEDKKMYTYEGEDIPKVWGDEGNDAMMVRLSSRPVPAPYDVDSWWVLLVL